MTAPNPSHPSNPTWEYEMTVAMKRTLAGAFAAFLVIAGTAFVTWGFDPAGWEWAGRLEFVFVLSGVVFLAAAFPFEDDRP